MRISNIDDKENLKIVGVTNFNRMQIYDKVIIMVSVCNDLMSSSKESSRSTKIKFSACWIPFCPWIAGKLF
ncbi:MAG: hypothetical protein ACP6IU_15300 [Candidatus Asgardarchaeia archaeon]